MLGGRKVVGETDVMGKGMGWMEAVVGLDRSMGIGSNGGVRKDKREGEAERALCSEAPKSGFC